MARERENSTVVRYQCAKATNGKADQVSPGDVLGPRSEVEGACKDDEGTRAESGDEDGLLYAEEEQDKEGRKSA